MESCQTKTSALSHLEKSEDLLESARQERDDNKLQASAKHYREAIEALDIDNQRNSSSKIIKNMLTQARLEYRGILEALNHQEAPSGDAKPASLNNLPTITEPAVKSPTLQNCKYSQHKDDEAAVSGLILLTDKKNIIQFLVDKVNSDPAYKNNLFQDIERSKKDSGEQVEIKAANAITILNKAGESFSGRDFNDIRIPHADCSQGVFHGTQMKRANLKGVNFSCAYLQDACLDESNLEDLEVGERASLKGHSLPIQCMAYDETYQLIATGSGEKNKDCGIRIWDVNTSTLIQSLAGHKDTVLGLAFIPKSKTATLLSLSQDKTIKIWDVTTGESSTHCLPVFPSSVMALSPNGELLAFASVKGSKKTEESKEIAEQTIISIWSLDSKTIKKSWSAHQGKAVTALRFITRSKSPKALKLASSGKDEKLVLWNLKIALNDPDKIPSSIWTQDAEASSSLAFMEAAEKIISCVPHGADLRQVSDGALRQELRSKNLQSHTRSAACSEDYIAIGDDENIQIFDKTGTAGRFLNGHANAIIEMIFTKGQGAFLLSASLDRTVRLWNTQVFKQTSIYSQHTRAITCSQLTHDEKTVITASLDGTIKYWDASTGHWQKTLAFETSGTTAFILAQGGELLIAGDTEGWIYIYSLKTDTFDKFKAHTGTITHVNTFIDTNQKQLISSGQDETLRLWDLQTKQLLKTFNPRGLRIAYIRQSFFSKDGRNLYTADSQNLAKIWEIERGILLDTIGEKLQPISAALLSLDGRQLLLGNKKSFAIEVWDLKSRKRIQRYEGPSAPVKSLSWDASAQYLISGDEANCIYLWHRDNPQPILRFKMTAPIQATILSSNATRLYVAQTNDLTLYGFKLNHEPKVKASLQYQIGGRLNVQGLNINRVTEFPTTLSNLFKSLNAIGDSLNASFSKIGYPTQTLYALDNRNLSPLQVAIKAQDETQVRAIVQAKVDINQASFGDQTAMQLAAFYGLRRFCEMLIAAGAAINQADNEGATPLYIAAQNGHENIADLLLAKGANPKQPKTDGATPLFIAVCNNHQRMATLLLTNGADSNQATNIGYTPLCIAAFKDYEAVMTLLLAKGANPSQTMDDGATPLYIAAQQGQEMAARLLLADKRVDPNQARTDNGATPLFIAISQGHENIVDLLLAKGANPNQARTDNGATPLYIAAQNGKEGTVKLLLADKRVDPNQAQQEGATPLYIAAQNGKEGTVKLLLAHPRVDPNQGKNNGATPLYIAAQNGKEGTVKLLLADKRVDPNQAQQEGATPLYIAAQNGKEGTVKLLLAHPRVDPNQAQQEGATPLFIAAQNGKEGTVKLLLADKRVDPNQATTDGSTPLFIAAQNGKEGTVKLLLADKRVDPNQANTEGFTSLHQAAGEGHNTTVKLLVDKGAKLNAINCNGWTPLMLSTYNGHKNSAQTLLENHADKNLADRAGVTPLVMAIIRGNLEIAELLVKKGCPINQVIPLPFQEYIDVAVKGGAEGLKEWLDIQTQKPQPKLNITLLMIAAYYQKAETIQLLLNNKADIQAKDNEGNTALHWTYKNKEVGSGLIDLLLTHKADLNLPNAEGKTALALCEARGDAVLTQYLHQRASAGPLKAEQESKVKTKLNVI